MFPTEEEMILIFKKALPKATYKELLDIEKEIVNDAKQQWPTLDLHNDLHNDMKSKVLHDIVQGKGVRKTD